MEKLILVKFLVAGILGGFVLGIFTVAVLGWINDVKEEKELQKQLEELQVKTHD